MLLQGQHIGVIAGSGDLPYAVISAAREAGANPYLIAIEGSAKHEDFAIDGQTIGIAQFGKMTNALKSQGCQSVVFAGYVKRPNFKHIKPDLKAVKYVPGALKAASKGDDALLSYIVGAFEKEGLEVISPQQICTNLLIGNGLLGRVSPTVEDQADMACAMEIAAVIGRNDIGQAAVVCNGLVLAVEAQEGTDMMLQRIATLDPDIRGDVKARKGVLAKRVKPGAEERVDLPTIGPKTIENAAKAGLAGIVLESGRAFVMERETVIRNADENGLFVIGIDPA